MAVFELRVIKYAGLRPMNIGDTFINKTNSQVTISKREIIDGKEKYTPLKKLEPNETYTANESIELAIQTFSSNPKYTIVTSTEVTN